MIIRKQFKFEGAHIVRNCTSQRCRENIHGHSYIVEVFITSDRLDNGYMVMDFCRLKQVKEFIESFDHSYSLWNRENQEFKDFIYRYNKRVVEIPVSPSAEGYALLFLYNRPDIPAYRTSERRRQYPAPLGEGTRNSHRLCGSIPGGPFVGELSHG